MNSLTKNILMIGLVLIIIGVTGLALNKSQIGNDYFSWMKSVFLSNFGFLKAGLTSNVSFDQPDLNFSEINIENLMPQKEADQEADESEEQVDVQETGESEYIISLEKIAEKIKVIEKKVNKIEEEVNRLKTFTEIQEKINEITKQIDALSQEMNDLT